MSNYNNQNKRSLGDVWNEIKTVQTKYLKSGNFLSEEQKDYIYRRILHEMMIGNTCLPLYGFGNQDAIKEWLQTTHNIKCRAKTKIFYFNESKEIPYYEAFWN